MKKFQPRNKIKPISFAGVNLGQSRFNTSVQSIFNVPFLRFEGRFFQGTLADQIKSLS